MIDIELFINTLTDLTKQNQSVYADGNHITRTINLCSNELAQYLYAIYEVNQNAADLASPVIEPFTATSNATGFINYPTGYNHLLSLQLSKDSKEIKMQRINVNQLGIIQMLPQRRPNLAKNRVLYYFLKDGIQLLPKVELNVIGIIKKYPPDAKIEYTYTLVNNEPKRQVNTATKVNIPWGNNVFSLLLYMVMDKLGFSARDLLQTEYAKLGIQKETIETKN